MMMWSFLSLLRLVVFRVCVISTIVILLLTININININLNIGPVAVIATRDFYIPNAFNNQTTTNNQTAFTIDILHTAELFGRIAPVVINGSNLGTECNLQETLSNVFICDSAAGQSGGGLSRLQTYVQTSRLKSQQNANWSTNAARPILIDAGDLWFGSTVYNALEVTPFPDLIERLEIDVMGMGLYEVIDDVQQTQVYYDALPKHIPVIVSNINATGDEFLGSNRPGVSYQSGSSNKYESWYVKSVPTSGVTNSSVPVGFVGCLFEQTNNQGAVGKRTYIDPDPEGSIRFAIQRMQRAYPLVRVIVLISSCSPSVNERLARNIIEIDVIVENNSQLYSNSELPAAGVVDKYPKVIANNVGAPCLLVAAGLYGARVGHLAVQFDNQGNALSWMGDSILLNSSYAPEPTMLSKVSDLLTQTNAFESRIIGRATSDIKGDDCRYNDCSAGEFTMDALLWYCKDCVGAFLNGGAYGGADLISSPTGGDLTIKDLYKIARFSNTIATFYITGAVLLEALQVGLKFNSMMQVAGIRYAYNPDTSVPLTLRIVDVSIWSPYAKTYLPLVLSQSYKIAASDYIALGGGGHLELLQNAQQLNRYLPLLREVYHLYIVANSPINATTQKQLASCTNTTYILEAKQGKTVWPAPSCRIIRSSGSQDLLKVCPTNPLMKFGQQVYDGMIAGVTVVNSSMKACSGLGTCALQQCTCAVATEGMYAGLTMVRGVDCSVVRREYKFSSAGRVILLILSAIVIVLSIFTSIFYGVHHSDRIIRASSPLFMHVSCVGTILTALSVIISLSPYTDGMCAAQYWTLAIGFGMTFGSLFAKTYRLYRIFHQRQIQIVSISNWQVLSIVTGVVAIECLILIIFQAVSPLTVTGTLMDDEQAWSYTLQCSSSKGASFAAALIAFNCFLLLIGTFLAVELRHIDGTFNETKYLGMAIYNTSMVTCIVLPLVYIFRDTYPTFVMAFRSIFILYCASFVLLVVTIPKYLAIRHTRSKLHTPRKRSSLGRNVPSTTPPLGGSELTPTHTTHDDDMHLPKIRPGDLAGRTQILQELMSNMSDRKKLARMEKYIANVSQHLTELKRMEKQIRDQMETTTTNKPIFAGGDNSQRGSIILSQKQDKDNKQLFSPNSGIRSSISVDASSPLATSSAVGATTGAGAVGSSGSALPLTRQRSSTTSTTTFPLPTIHPRRDTRSMSNSSIISTSTNTNTNTNTTASSIHLPIRIHTTATDAHSLDMGPAHSTATSNIHIDLAAPLPLEAAPITSSADTTDRLDDDGANNHNRATTGKNYI